MDYTPLSRQPFAGDPFVGQEIAKLCKDYCIQTIVETGTQSGSTAKAMNELTGLTVLTIEHDSKWFDPVVKALCNPFNGIYCYYGLSTLWLEKLKPNPPVLFFLDAHDMEGTPIRGELKLIGKNFHKPVVVVHDCLVPDNPELGFDKYNDGTILSYDSFKDAIAWPHRVYYNAHAEGAKRGVCYIIPT